MATLLLLVIYMAFISLGLPDAILGVAWPEMRIDLNVPLDASGFIFITSTASTIISSLASGFLIKKFSTAYVTLFSILITSLSLLGFSLMPSFYWMILLAIPLGFGAGSIDTALNNYVAIHYKTHHMNFLHAFWGIGATLGPIIMSTFFALKYTWRNGYMALGIIQLGIFFIVLLSLPLWKKNNLQEIKEKKEFKYKDILKTKGVKTSMSIFVIYCAVEFSIGSWGASYLVESKNLLPSIAGALIGVYYLGITIGRLLSGVISFKLTNSQLIISGIIIFIISSLLFLLPLPVYTLYGLFFFQGVGLAPIFPSLTHETPKRFTQEKSQYVIGLQIASAYAGASIFPSLFGILAKNTSLSIFPYYILLFSIKMLILNLSLVKTFKKET